jgi:hypothetical protein
MLHAGNANSYAIGIDICRSPRTIYAAHYGLTPQVNTTGRGDRMYLELPEDVGARVGDFLGLLSGILGVSFGTYPGHALLAAATANQFSKITGVVGHHNLSPRKWDVAPWAHRIWRS